LPSAFSRYFSSAIIGILIYMLVNAT